MVKKSLILISVFEIPLLEKSFRFENNIKFINNRIILWQFIFRQEQSSTLYIFFHSRIIRVWHSNITRACFYSLFLLGQGPLRKEQLQRIIIKLVQQQGLQNFLSSRNHSMISFRLYKKNTFISHEIKQFNQYLYLLLISCQKREECQCYELPELKVILKNSSKNNIGSIGSMWSNLLKFFNFETLIDVYNQSLNFKGKKIMSLILLPEDQFYSQFKPSKYYTNTNISSLNQKFLDRDSSDNRNNELKSGKQTIFSQIHALQPVQRQVIMLDDLIYQFKGLFSIKTDRKKQIYSFSINLLADNDHFYKVANTFQVTQICRNFNVYHARLNNVLFCLKINPHKRQIKIQLPFYLNNSWAAVKSGNKITQNINSIFRTLIKPHLSMVQLSLKNILRYQVRVHSKDHLFQKTNQTLQLLKTYTSISYLTSHITCQPQVDYLSLQKIESKQKESFKKILTNIQTLQFQFIKNNRLFVQIAKYQSSDSLTYTFQQLKRNAYRNFKDKVSFPLPIENQKSQDNFMVYNKIEVKDINQKQMQIIKKGGFANIYLTQMSYWYSQTPESLTQSYKTLKNLIHEKVVIKREIASKEIFEFARNSICQSRNEHQYKILQKLKKAKSIFLPKYYFPTNIKKVNNHIFQKCLLIEYIPCKTLGQLLENNAEYLSLQFKLSLMFSLCQGLRYLRDFDIVHLDIKPNNILTYYKSYIKLIDFGQSYHPDVCVKGHKPGFTIPYSPPEIFNQKVKLYSSKSDVFSMGMLFYQILFNQFPFDFYKSTTQYNDQMIKNLQQGWYYSPEQKQSYGEHQIMRILINLISRCLCFNPKQRPQLDWIAIILKYLLQTVN